METEENNFYRLIAFLIDVAPEVVRYYFKRNILCGETFESFLNKHKHILFHLMSTKLCCECKGINNHQRQHLSNEQFHILYKRSSTGVEHKGNRTCICVLVAKQNLSVRVLDLTLSFIILQNCLELTNDIAHWMTTLKEIRNSLVHSTDTKSVDNSSFERFWTTLQGAVLGIAASIEVTPYENYKDIILSKIEFLKSRHLLSEDKIKLSQLLHEWCVEKFSEMERILLQNNEQATSNQAHTIDIIESLRSRIDKLIEKETSNTYSSPWPNENYLSNSNPDNKSTLGNKLFSVLMEIETPMEWDESKVNNTFTRINSLLTSVDSSINIRLFSVKEKNTRSQQGSAMQRPTGLFLSTNVGIQGEPSSSSMTESTFKQLGLQGRKSLAKTVYVQNIEKRIRPYFVQKRDTVRDLKRSIHIEEKIHPDRQLVSFNGVELEDSHSLDKKGVEDKCLVVLTLRPANELSLATVEGKDPTMRSLYIHEENGKLTSLNFANCTTIFDLKRQILHERKPVLPFNFVLYLYLNGVLLNDGQTLHDCGIEGNVLLSAVYGIYPRPVTQLQICFQKSEDP